MRRSGGRSMTGHLLPFRKPLAAPPTVYLETSVISYLAARPSRDLVVRAHQAMTREWWDTRRSSFELYVSVEVLGEIDRGDPSAAQARRRYVEGLPAFGLSSQAEALAFEILQTSALPWKARSDALHIAIATVNAIDVLLTWDRTHIANAIIQRKIIRLTRKMGLQLPAIVTPAEMLGG
jgi:predicted nucleic acid-binding protein